MTRKGRDKTGSTGNRILKAACEVFAEKGFPSATVRDICNRADVNLALVNYHFGSKSDLYQAVWQNALDTASDLYPSDGGVADSAPAEERLDGFVRSFLSRMTDRERLEHFHRIRMMEFANPTGLIDGMMKKLIQKNQALLESILNELAGPAADRKHMELCRMSIMSQCFMARPRKHPESGKPGNPRRKFTLKDVDMLTDHIVRFSLAGIKAVQKK